MVLRCGVRGSAGLAGVGVVAAAGGAGVLVRLPVSRVARLGGVVSVCWRGCVACVVGGVRGSAAGCVVCVGLGVWCSVPCGVRLLGRGC